jgi:hypothetical protein
VASWTTKISVATLATSLVARSTKHVSVSSPAKRYDVCVVEIGEARESETPTMAHQAKHDALRLLRCINDTQAQGQEGARVDLPRAAQQIEMDVGSERYHAGLAHLVDEGALEGDEHTAAQTGSQSPGYAGYGVYFFTRRAVEMLEEGPEVRTTTIDPDDPEAHPEAY